MQKFVYFSALFTALMTASIPAAQAEDIHLTADDKVEWHQNEQKMIAIGNAVATQKDMNIRADKMTAFYESSKKGGEKARTNIRDIQAQGGVVMTAPSAKAYGDNMTYNLIDDIMVLKGSPVSKIITNDGKIITATDNITYYPSKNKAIASGDVIAKDDDSTIYSNKMISYFTKNSNGQSELDKVEIYSDNKEVKIINDQAVVTGEQGIYLPKINKVRLYRNVVINQDGNILKGDYAETDLKTGISRVLSDKKSGKRVSGIFIEKDKNEKEAKTPAEKNTKPENQTTDWNLK